MSYHKLTEQIWDIYTNECHSSWSAERLDSITRQELGEMARHIAYSFPKDGSHEGRERWARSVFGLEEENPESCGWDGEGECPKHIHGNPSKPTPPSEEKWCEHMDVDYVRIYLDKKTFGGTGSTGMECDKNGVKFCPICGTPRPKVKTLAERLRDQANEMPSDIYESYTKRYEYLARIAEEWFKENK